MAMKVFAYIVLAAALVRQEMEADGSLHVLNFNATVGGPVKGMIGKGVRIFHGIFLSEGCKLTPEVNKLTLRPKRTTDAPRTQCCSCGEDGDKELVMAFELDSCLDLGRQNMGCCAKVDKKECEDKGGKGVTSFSPVKFQLIKMKSNQQQNPKGDLASIKKSSSCEAYDKGEYNPNAQQRVQCCQCDKATAAGRQINLFALIRDCRKIGTHTGSCCKTPEDEQQCASVAASQGSYPTNAVTFPAVTNSATRATRSTKKAAGNAWGKLSGFWRN